MEMRERLVVVALYPIRSIEHQLADLTLPAEESTDDLHFWQVKRMRGDHDV